MRNPHAPSAVANEDMTALADVPLNVLDLAWRGYGQTNADAVAGSL